MTRRSYPSESNTVNHIYLLKIKIIIFDIKTLIK
jgi:hypothetical protein